LWQEKPFFTAERAENAERFAWPVTHIDTIVLAHAASTRPASHF